MSRRTPLILKMLQNPTSDGKIWLRLASPEALPSDLQMLAQLESEITTRQDYYQICGRW
jgi:hypothetical protein